MNPEEIILHFYLICFVFMYSGHRVREITICKNSDYSVQSNVEAEYMLLSINKTLCLRWHLTL